MNDNDNQQQTTQNIIYSLYDDYEEEDCEYINEEILKNMLDEFERLPTHEIDCHGIFEVEELNYETNYTVKQLTHIGEYYGLKMTKKKKQEIITMILLFEGDKNNNEKVVKRKKTWEFLNELKNDPIMKKFVIW
jgi:hypothetical protein